MRSFLDLTQANAVESAASAMGRIVASLTAGGLIGLNLDVCTWQAVSQQCQVDHSVAHALPLEYFLQGVARSSMQTRLWRSDRKVYAEHHA